MDKIKIYIPLTIVSIILLTISFKRKDQYKKILPSIEFENVVHKKIEPNAFDTEKILSVFQKGFNKINSDRYLLLFISGAENCTNSLNEINDYVTISNHLASKNQSFSSYMFYYGKDSLSANRFILSSGINEIIDETAFIDSTILKILINPLIDYETENILYLYDTFEKRIFHGFILPSGRTTKLSSKESAFINAITTNNQ